MEPSPPPQLSLGQTLVQLLRPENRAAGLAAAAGHWASEPSATAESLLPALVGAAADGGAEAKPARRRAEQALDWWAEDAGRRRGLVGALGKGLAAEGDAAARQQALAAAVAAAGCLRRLEARLQAGEAGEAAAAQKPVQVVIEAGAGGGPAVEESSVAEWRPLLGSLAAQLGRGATTPPTRLVTALADCALALLRVLCLARTHAAARLDAQQLWAKMASSSAAVVRACAAVVQPEAASGAPLVELAAEFDCADAAAVRRLAPLLEWSCPEASSSKRLRAFLAREAAASTEHSGALAAALLRRAPAARVERTLGNRSTRDEAAMALAAPASSGMHEAVASGWQVVLVLCPQHEAAARALALAQQLRGEESAASAALRRLASLRLAEWGANCVSAEELISKLLSDDAAFEAGCCCLELWFGRSELSQALLETIIGGIEERCYPHCDPVITAQKERLEALLTKLPLQPADLVPRLLRSAALTIADAPGDALLDGWLRSTATAATVPQKAAALIDAARDVAATAAPTSPQREAPTSPSDIGAALVGEAVAKPSRSNRVSKDILDVAMEATESWSRDLSEGQRGELLTMAIHKALAAVEDRISLQFLVAIHAGRGDSGEPADPHVISSVCAILASAMQGEAPGSPSSTTPQQAERETMARLRPLLVLRTMGGGTLRAMHAQTAGEAGQLLLAQIFGGMEDEREYTAVRRMAAELCSWLPLRALLTQAIAALTKSDIEENYCGPRAWLYCLCCAFNRTMLGVAPACDMPAEVAELCKRVGLAALQLLASDVGMLDGAAQNPASMSEVQKLRMGCIDAVAALLVASRLQRAEREVGIFEALDAALRDGSANQSVLQILHTLPRMGSAAEAALLALGPALVQAASAHAMVGARVNAMQLLFTIVLKHAESGQARHLLEGCSALSVAGLQGREELHLVCAKLGTATLAAAATSWDDGDAASIANAENAAALVAALTVVVSTASFSAEVRSVAQAALALTAQ